MGFTPYIVVELAWTALGIIGASIVVTLLMECLRDVHALHKAPSFIPGGPRAIASRMHIRNTSVKLIVLLCFVFAGCVSLAFSPRLQTLSISFRTIATTSAFILAELTIVISTIKDRSDRTEFFRKVQRGASP